MTGREKLRIGDFNYMSQTTLPDGSLEIILTKRGDPAKYRLVVRNLYHPDEVVLIDEVISSITLTR